MTKTCLIVDDNPTILKITTEMVKIIGFKTLEACNAEEGLLLTANENIDVILLDWHLPDENGLECAKYIKEHYPNKNIKIVLYSTIEGRDGDTKVKNSIYSDYIDAYADKPVSGEGITKAFKEVGVL